MNIGRRGPQADINVTPMIDVLLVLLVIFMVVTPTLSRGLEANAPQQAASATESPDNPLVLTIAADGSLDLNQEHIERASLHDRLVQIATLRASGMIFVRPDRSLEFREVAQVVDAVRGAGLRASLMKK